MDFTYRIIDANFNRSREGLRVMEEYARFALNDSSLTEKIKNIRHQLAQLVGKLPQRKLLDNRDTPGDVGTTITLESEARRDNIISVIKAASSRVSEALRAIEEYTKTSSHPEIATGIEQLRYLSYELEKQLIGKITRKKFNNVALYVLITEELCRLSPVETAREILKAGVDCIQYREKDILGQQTIDQLLSIAELCRENDSMLIINDRCDLAQISISDGAHLGQSDIPPAYARELLGFSAIIGRTCHNLDEVSTAKTEDVDYIGIGSIFGSPTKPEVPKTGTKFISDTRKLYRGPIIAIGGVTKDNAAEAILAGADGVAVCQSIISAANPAKAAEDMKNTLTNAKKQIKNN